MMRALRKQLALWLAAVRFQLGADDDAAWRKRKRGISQRFRKRNNQKPPHRMPARRPGDVLAPPKVDANATPKG